MVMSEEINGNKRKKRRVLYVVAGIIMALIVIAAAAIVTLSILFPGFIGKTAALLSLREAASGNVIGYDLNLSVSVDGSEYTVNAGLSRTEDDSVKAVTIEDREFYYSSKTLFLENGTAYALGDIASESFNARELIRIYLEDASFERTEEDGYKVFSASLNDEGRASVLELLQENTDDMDVVEDVSLIIYVSNGNAGKIAFSAAGEMSGGTELCVIGELSLIWDGAEENEPGAVPEAVAELLSAGEWETAGIITDDVLRLAGAWKELSSRDIMESVIYINADIGILNIDREVSWTRTVSENGVVNHMETGALSFSFYDDDDAGEDDEAAVSGYTDLLKIAYDAFADGGISCTDNGDGTYTYSVALSEERLAQAVNTIVSGTESMDIEYSDGYFQVITSESKIKSVSFECGGNIMVLFVDVGISIAARIEIED